MIKSESLEYDEECDEKFAFERVAMKGVGLSSNPLFLRPIKPKEVELKEVEEIKERISLDSIERLTSLPRSELHSVAEILSCNPLAPIGDTEIYTWWPTISSSYSYSSSNNINSSTPNTTTDPESLLPEKILGEGAFGRVWLASKNREASNIIAVKQLSLEDLTLAKQSFRAGRELRALRTLRQYHRYQQHQQDEQETSDQRNNISLSFSDKQKLTAAKISFPSSFCIQLEGSFSTTTTSTTTTTTSSYKATSSSSPFLYLMLEAAPDGITLADVVKSISYDEENDLPSLSLPSSPNLRQQLQRPKLDQIRFYIACILLALKELHGLGYAYRDIKLDNVVIAAESDRYPRLVDLGFIRSVRPMGTVCPQCGEKAEGEEELLKRLLEIQKLKTIKVDETHQSDKVSTVSTTLSSLPCCECPCVHQNGGNSVDSLLFQQRCTRMHRYHNLSESLIHLSKIQCHLERISNEKKKGVVDVDDDDDKKRTNFYSTTEEDIISKYTGPKKSTAKLDVDNGGGGGGAGARPQRSSSIVGTVAYLPPELNMVSTSTSASIEKEGSGGHDCAVDIWSLGVLAHELLTGVSPFSQRVLSATKKIEEDDDEEEEEEEDDDDIEVLKRALQASLLDLSSIIRIYDKKDPKTEQVAQDDKEGEGGEGRGGEDSKDQTAAMDAADFVRTLLQPDPSLRPCVHRAMLHPFFSRSDIFNWHDLLSRSIDPPPLPSLQKRRRTYKNEYKHSKEEDSEGLSSSISSSSSSYSLESIPKRDSAHIRFGGETFIGMSEKLFEARRAGGLLSSSSSSSHIDDPLELLVEFNL
jgi:serine/threonine protein kinase